MSAKTKRLTESAMLLAVAIVLELLSKLLIPEQAFGGQITVVSMLPVVLISYRHGMKWGLLACFTYSLLEMALGAKTVASAFLPGFFGDGAMIGKAVVMCLLDYVIAYTVLFLGGVFRGRHRADAGKHPGAERKISYPYRIGVYSLLLLGGVVFYPRGLPRLGRGAGGAAESCGPELTLQRGV